MCGHEDPAQPNTQKLNHSYNEVITSYRSQWLPPKSLQTISAGEGMERMEPSYTVGGNVNWYATVENSMEVP